MYNACMFIRRKTNPNSPRIALQIAENVRVGKKVVQKVLCHVGVVYSPEQEKELWEIAELRKATLEAAGAGQLFSPEEFAQMSIDGRELRQQQQQEQEKSDAPCMVDIKQLRAKRTVQVGVHEVYGSVYKELGLDNTIIPRKGKTGRLGNAKRTAPMLLQDIVMERIAKPQSKRGSVASLFAQFGVEHNLNAVYKMMDMIDQEAIDRIKSISQGMARRLFGETLNVLYYDCTTLHFESFDEDELRQKGFSKVNKTQETQIVLALAVTQWGFPVDYEVFPGSTYEGHTLQHVIARLKERWPQEKMRVVADSALLNSENVKWLESNKVEYILGGKPKTQSKQLKDQILQWSNSLSKTDKAHTTILLDDTHLFHVSYDPKRAKKDAHERDRMLEKLRKKFAKQKNVKSYLAGGRNKKYLKVDKDSTVSINEAQVASDAQWDGLHAVTTNVKDLAPIEVFDIYHGLWQVEDTFRLSKQDLRIRPIFHFKESRIHAHIAIAFMSLLCTRYLEHKVRIQQPKLKVSPKSIKEALQTVYIVVVQNMEDDKYYALPSEPSKTAQILYRITGKSHSVVPFAILPPRQICSASFDNLEI